MAACAQIVGRLYDGRLCSECAICTMAACAQNVLPVLRMCRQRTAPARCPPRTGPRPHPGAHQGQPCPLCRRLPPPLPASHAAQTRPAWRCGRPCPAGLPWPPPARVQACASVCRRVQEDVCKRVQACAGGACELACVRVCLNVSRLACVCVHVCACVLGWPVHAGACAPTCWDSIRQHAGLHYLAHTTRPSLSQQCK